MSRTKLTVAGTDLVTDSGNVSWSFIKGEQLEMPVDLALLGGAPNQNFIFECDYVESTGDTVTPLGAKGSITVRYLRHRGAWSATGEYSPGDCCVYDGKGYMRSGTTGINATPPASSPLWSQTSVNTVFLQFKSDFVNNFVRQPAVGAAATAFFELAVKEQLTAVESPNVNNLMPRIWKPVRGRIEVLYSPTSEVV
jgi:hypothetical protein